MVVDTVFQHITACAIAILFLSAGIQKFQQSQEFRSVLADYEVLPVYMIPLVFRLLPVLEITTGITLLFASMQILGTWLAIILLLGYALAMTINMLRGRSEIDCGCQLGSTGQSISFALVTRNLVLVAATASLLAPVQYRLMTWFDYGVITFGVLIACLLYAIGNNLITTHSRELT